MLLLRQFPYDMATSKTLLLFILLFLLTNNLTTSKGKFNTILSGIVEFCNRCCCWFCFFYHSLLFCISLDDMTRKSEKNTNSINTFFILVIFDGKQKMITWKNSLLPIGAQSTFLKLLCAGDKIKSRIGELVRVGGIKHVQLSLTS